MSLELSQRVARMVGSMPDPPSLATRQWLAEAAVKADSFGDLSKDVQAYIEANERRR